MRKITILLLLFFVCTNSFSQDYLKKSRNQKKAAIILLAGGSALVIGSFVFPQGELIYDGVCIGPYCTDRYKNDGIRATMFFVGGVAALSSIPFFIFSSKNKKRARSMGFKMENATYVMSGGLGRTSFPAIGIKLGL